MYLKLIKKDCAELLQYRGTPYYVYISLHNICNANCVFCDVNQKLNKHNILNISELLKQLKDMGTQYVHFIGGGEPFAHPNILKYMCEASELCMKIVITTNAYALTKEIIKKMKELNIDFIIISLDSHEPNMHNTLRNKSGLWERATQAIINLKKYIPNIKIVLNHLLHNENIDNFESFIKLRQQYPFDYINPLFIKDYCPLYIEADKKEVFQNKAKEFQKIAYENHVEFLYNITDQINFYNKNKSDQYIAENFSCYFPQYCSYVDCTTGNIYPCDCTIHRKHNDYIIGNLLYDSFKNIWNSSVSQELRSRLLHNNMNCRMNCDYNNVNTNFFLHVAEKSEK